MSGEVGSDHLFAKVMAEGGDEAIDAWLAAGPEAVHRLHQALTHERSIVVPDGTHDRVVLDNLGWASHEAARAFPDEFLTVFADHRWAENPFVCQGLGAIHRPEVTERLMGVLKSESRWLRIDAAVALRGHQHPNLQAALVAALDDPDELVRYHVEERLAEIGDETPSVEHEE